MRASVRARTINACRCFGSTNVSMAAIQRNKRRNEPDGQALRPMSIELLRNRGNQRDLVMFKRSAIFAFAAAIVVGVASFSVGAEARQGGGHGGHGGHGGGGGRHVAHGGGHGGHGGHHGPHRHHGHHHG